MKEKKDLATLEAFFSLVILLFLHSNPCFSYAYKRKSRAPHDGDPDEIKTKAHDTSTWLSGKRALSTRSLLPPETWDPLLSRLFITPTANQVLVTRTAVN